MDSLGLRYVDEPFGCCIDYVLAHVTAITELDLGWAKVGLDVEVDQAPVLQEGMQPDDATDISW